MARNTNDPFLIFDMKLYEKINNPLATVLYHRLFYLWTIDKNKWNNDDYVMISLRDIGKYFDKSASSIKNCIDLLCKHNLLEYKAEERGFSYIRFDISDENIIPYLRQYNLYKNL